MEKTPYLYGMFTIHKQNQNTGLDPCSHKKQDLTKKHYKKNHRRPKYETKVQHKNCNTEFDNKHILLC